MEDKKYLSLTGLTEYDTLIKAEIAEQNESTLSSAKSHIDEKISDLTSGNSTVSHATNADSAVMAETATKDANGNIIAETYETKEDAAAKLAEAKAYADSRITESGDIDLTDYQKKQDETLKTNNKTIVGAINELNGQGFAPAPIYKTTESENVVTLYTNIRELEHGKGYVVPSEYNDETKTYELAVYVLCEDGTEKYIDTVCTYVHVLTQSQTSCEVAFADTPRRYTISYNGAATEEDVQVNASLIYLDCDNNKTYEPVHAYNPATKKYVDDIASEKVSIAQGAENAGKVLVVNENGKVEVTTLSFDNKYQKINDASLATNNKTIVGAINELNASVKEIEAGSFEETDPTVPAWAKAATKPTYTYSEVGADKSGAAASALTNAKSYTDSALESAKSYTDEQIAALEEVGFNVESATKATQDGDGNVITSTYETKTDASSKLASAKSYTDSALKTAKSYADSKITELNVSQYMTDAEVEAKGYQTADDVQALIEENMTGGLEVPSTGTNGYVLTKTSDGVEWSFNAGKAGAGTNAEVFNGLPAKSALGNYSHAEGYGADTIPGNITASSNSSDVISAWNTASETTGRFSIALGKYSHVEGWGNLALNQSAHAEGTATIAKGQSDHAEGVSTEASGSSGSHAEGAHTVASGTAAHAEGQYTKATSEGAHSEGHSTEARGRYSHAEGDETIAKEWGSHAEGLETIASSQFQHVQGKYNIEDANNIYAHIVGNGTNTASGTTRSNAHTLDWFGNAWFAGNIHLGSNNDKVAILSDIPTNISAFTNDANYIVKVDGKDLSTNDYTNEEKQQLANLVASSQAGQSDWNESNESLASYIKNKPFYEIPEKLLVPYEERTFGLTGEIDGVEYPMGYFEVDFVIEEGKTYTVKLNDVTYTCVGTHYGNGESSDVAIGNLHFLDENLEDTGEPFYAAIMYGTSNSAMIVVELNSNLTTNDKYNFGLSLAAELKKIDEKFLPDMKVEVDTKLSSTSTNPVQNKAIYEALTIDYSKLEFDTSEIVGGGSSAGGGTNAYVDESGSLVLGGASVDASNNLVLNSDSIA